MDLYSNLRERERDYVVKWLDRLREGVFKNRRETVVLRCDEREIVK